MFGLQKQRRNATSSGAWFIAGHLTVFAKLSHHAVRLESRIFSSRCFRVLRNLAPPGAFPFPPSAAPSPSHDVRFLFLAGAYLLHRSPPRSGSPSLLQRTSSEFPRSLLRVPRPRYVSSSDETEESTTSLFAASFVRKRIITGGSEGSKYSDLLGELNAAFFFYFIIFVPFHATCNVAET